ncbi:hypothetical protein DFH08DRAFT_1005967 [Mycena albidolilacea]|uniref:Uncharacterized protein n=1 Tax=Mycena albidolilacea TaxID=1033008 RepID=A0AAD7F3X4_9AGAR|nr:hypothetical protein DFH08DRAFT_1005967 [Mycena albidolilacea]
MTSMAAMAPAVVASSDTLIDGGKKPGHNVVEKTQECLLRELRSKYILTVGLHIGLVIVHLVTSGTAGSLTPASASEAGHFYDVTCPFWLQEPLANALGASASSGFFVTEFPLLRCEFLSLAALALRLNWRTKADVSTSGNFLPTPVHPFPDLYNKARHCPSTVPLYWFPNPPHPLGLSSTVPNVKQVPPTKSGPASFSHNEQVSSTWSQLKTFGMNPLRFYCSARWVGASDSPLPIFKNEVLQCASPAQHLLVYALLIQLFFSLN